MRDRISVETGITDPGALDVLTLVFNNALDLHRDHPPRAPQKLDELKRISPKLINSLKKAKAALNELDGDWLYVIGHDFDARLQALIESAMQLDNLPSPGRGAGKYPQWDAVVWYLASNFAHACPDRRLSNSENGALYKYVALWMQEVGGPSDPRRIIERVLREDAARAEHG